MLLNSPFFTTGFFGNADVEFETTTPANNLNWAYRGLGGSALLMALATAPMGCGGGGGGDGQSRATPAAPQPPPPPPVSLLAIDTAPEPAVCIVGHPTVWAARASLTFRFTVDRVG